MILKIIETRRLLLKGLSPNDMKLIFENNSKDEIKGILGHRSEEDFIKEEFKQRSGYSSYNRSFILFLLIDKASNCIIGRCALHNWNKENSRAEIGYHIEDNNFKRQGLMSEAIEAILEYGFNQINLNRIEALASVNNIPSLQLLEKYNFKREGLLSQHRKTLDQYEDSVLLSLLYDDYNCSTNKKSTEIK